MSKHTLKYEYIIKPNNIESEVPAKQKLRERQNDNSAENNKSDAGKEKDGKFVPVMTIKKEETALTKGDIKLQKVMVTEDVAEEDNSNNAKIINPFYSEIQSMVISGPQPLRECPKDTKIGDDNREFDRDGEEKKQKTKIPSLKFKQTVEKVQKEMNNSTDEKNKMKRPTQARRSSIPKLRRKRRSTSISDDSANVNNKETNTDKPDEEFDKLFHGVIDDKQVEAVVEKILPEKIEDLDELETSFEEIIHAYDDNKIEPATIGNNISKIPLNKQKSLHEESKPRQAERRLSLKNICLDEKTQQNMPEFSQKIAKTCNFVSKKPADKKDEHKTNAPTTEEHKSKPKSNDIVRTDKKENKPKSMTIKDKSLYSPIEHTETGKLKRNNQEKQMIQAGEIEFIYDTDTSANLKSKQLDDKNKIPPENPNSKLPNSSKIVMNLIPSHIKNKDHDNNERTQSLNEVNKTFKEEVKTVNSQNNRLENVREPNSDKSNMISESHQNNSDNNTANTKSSQLQPKRSILSKIAIFQGKEAPANKQNSTEKDLINENEFVKQKQDSIIMTNIDIKQKNNSLKEAQEHNNEETLEISQKGENIQDIKNNANIQRDSLKPDINNKEDNKSYSRVNNNNKTVKANNYEDASDCEKISDSIIGSSDQTKLTPQKEKQMETRKTRSVLSKIAMFERQSSKETVNVKEDLPKNKLQIHTLIEIDINDVEHRKPKIIDTVLKSQPLRKSYTEDDDSNPKITIADSETIIDPNQSTREVCKNKTQNMQQTEMKDLKTLQATESNEPSKLEEFAKSDVSKTLFENKSNKGTEIKTLERKSQDYLMIRSKSAADLPLGDNVKGKVHQLLVKIHSLEKIEVDKKEIISVKERPRKRSVSEKIALFEKKLTPVKLESTETTAAQPPPKNETKNDNHLPKPLSEEEYAKQIEELEKASEVYGKIKKMPYVTLRDGKKMPVLAVGTALLDPRLIQPIIKAAIDLGYRAIDAAFIYGNEKEIGEAIKAKIDDGTVTRDELFIVNKLWNSFHRQDLVEKACNASLTAMGLDYFDLYLVHSPISFKEGKEAVPKIASVIQYSDYDYMDAWYGMEDLVTKGLVKSVGVSNFNEHQVARIDEKARIKPVVNQVECHPYLSQQRLDQTCAVRGIKLSCFGVLGSKGTPEELKTNLLPVIDDPLLVVMAAGLNVTPAQLLVRYQIDSGHLAVVKASSAAHLWNNLEALGFELTPSQLYALNTLNRNKRTYTFKGMGDTHRNYPFKASF